MKTTITAQPLYDTPYQDTYEIVALRVKEILKKAVGSILEVSPIPGKSDRLEFDYSFPTITSKMKIDMLARILKPQIEKDFIQSSRRIILVHDLNKVFEIISTLNRIEVTEIIS